MVLSHPRRISTGPLLHFFWEFLVTYGKMSKQYYKDCYIEGTVDFIFGSSTAFFDNCQIHSLGRGYLTAASTPEGRDHGYVLRGCRLTAEPGVELVMLGRPWRPYAKTVFVDIVLQNTAFCYLIHWSTIRYVLSTLH